jgi:hypothetical protein
MVNAKTKKMTKSTRNTKKIILAIAADAMAISVNPKILAIKEIIRKMMAHFNINFLHFLTFKNGEIAKLKLVAFIHP